MPFKKVRGGKLEKPIVLWVGQVVLANFFASWPGMSRTRMSLFMYRESARFNTLETGS